MAKKKVKNTTRHRLLVYHQLGQRLRVPPLLTIVLGFVLYAIGWMGSQSIIRGGDAVLLNNLWAKRNLILLVIVGSVFLYIVMLMISRRSYVEARPKALHVQAGFLALDVSYGRINQIRLVELGTQYPPEALKGNEYSLLAPLMGRSCTAVDLTSWPMDPGLLRRLWSKFMFIRKGSGLLFVVEDAMVLNQQIDNYVTRRQTRTSKKPTQYQDPIDRAFHMERKRRGKRQ